VQTWSMLALVRSDNPGLHVSLSFKPEDNVAAPYLNLSQPRVAILT